MTEPVFALLTGGGTGGHTYPAIAVAQELVAPRPHSRLAAVRRRAARHRRPGRARGRVRDRPAAGARAPAAADVRERRRRSSGAVAAFVRAIGLVRRYRPRVVVGFGGYASLPCVAAARVLRVPTLVHEQDAAPGLANRIGVRLGARAAVSLPGTPLPGATLTGQPGALDVPRGRRVAGAPARRCVAVFGGAQGARTINRAAHRLLRPWRARARRRGAPRVRAAQRRRVQAALAAQRRADDALVLRARAATSRTWTDLFAAGAARGVPVRGRHHRRAHRGRRAGGARAAPGRAQRPPDAQRAHARTGRRGGGGARRRVRPGAARPGRHRSARASPSSSRRWARRHAALGRPDAAARVADLVEEHARAALTAQVTVPPLDLTRPRRVHIVGIGGAGMSAIALAPRPDGPHGERLRPEGLGRARPARSGRGCHVHVGNRAENVPPDADAVVYSTAIPLGNVELVAARELGISVLHRPRRWPRWPRRGARSRSPVRTARPRRRRCSR